MNTALLGLQLSDTKDQTSCATLPRLHGHKAQHRRLHFVLLLYQRTGRCLPAAPTASETHPGAPKRGTRARLHLPGVLNVAPSPFIKVKAFYFS